MNELSLRARPVLDEVVHADAHVFEPADLSKACALETQSFHEWHACAFQDRFLKDGVHGS